MRRVCVVCGVPFTSTRRGQKRCDPHEAEHRTAKRASRGISGGAWETLRRQRIAIDGGTCTACPATTGLEVHHVVPVADGGVHELHNLRTLCASCHDDQHRRGA